MKVLLYHLMPFALAHGGLQNQIVQSCNALGQLGVEVEFLRWMDPGQRGDSLHFFGRMPTEMLLRAQNNRMKVVLTDLLGAQGARPAWRLKLQAMSIRAIQRILPAASVARLGWQSYRLADACVASTLWEACLMTTLFGALPGKTHVISNGVEDVFLQSRPTPRGPWLLCVATITPIKRVLELAQAALRAQIPLRIIGRPYFESDGYVQQFSVLARAHPQAIRHEARIEDSAELMRAYREARGFVLLSAYETLSLSALEAAACECPLLLSRLPWATTSFGESACYCPITSSAARTAAYLRQFYDAAPGLKPPPRPLAWLEVGQQLKRLYETLLNTSR